MEHNKREGHFNGHTWIIVLVSVLVLGCIALTEIFVGLEIIKTNNNVAITMATEITLGTIPLQVVIGIVIIIKRITYIPKQVVKEEKHEEENSKNSQSGPTRTS